MHRVLTLLLLKGCEHSQRMEKEVDNLRYLLGESDVDLHLLHSHHHPDKFKEYVSGHNVRAFPYSALEVSSKEIATMTGFHNAEEMSRAVDWLVRKRTDEQNESFPLEKLAWQSINELKEDAASLKPSVFKQY